MTLVTASYWFAVTKMVSELCHRLEHTMQLPFVLTDHKNLEHIRSAKRMNSRQVQWTLFLTRFNVTLSHQPGSNKVKLDASSH